MLSLRNYIKPWRMAFGALWEKLAPTCGYAGCVHAGSGWRRARRRKRGIHLQGVWYCRPECLEPVVGEFLRRARVVPRHAASPSHRVPLGLLLLSRQQLTAVQLKTALAVQRADGQGKIGEWLQELGFATEQQVTAALARQWSCPVLRISAEALGAGRFPTIPLLLLQSFQMIPVEFVEATATLLVAFSDGIDYTVLYAIEQMLGCHTEPCLVCPGALRMGLQLLAQRCRACDVVFDRLEDSRECARIISNYTAKVRAQQVRLARCGDYLWIRLERRRQDAVNLMLRARVHNLHTPPLHPSRHLLYDLKAGLSVPINAKDALPGKS